MPKKLLVLAAFLFLTLFAQAEVDIPEGSRVLNYPSGCCAWCAVENLAHIHHVTQLDGITKKRHERSQEQIYIAEGNVFFPGQGWMRVGGYWRARNDAGATPQSMQAQLDELKVRYKLQDEQSHDMKIVLDAVKENRGCAVGLRNWPRPGDYHMVTLTDLDNEKFIFIENRGRCDRYLGTRAWFDQHWSGFTVVIYPNEN